MRNNKKNKKGPNSDKKIWNIRFLKELSKKINLFERKTKTKEILKIMIGKFI